ncbi:MAG: hypothetical protein PHV39_01985 [Methanomicrobium sp.]|nr:hypothetical protein [Methanomicrobium sp.]
MPQEYPDNEAVFLYKNAEEKYWEAVWWYDRSVIETDKTAQAYASGKAATGFSKVIAWSGQIQSLCKSRQE